MVPGHRPPGFAVVLGLVSLTIACTEPNEPVARVDVTPSRVELALTDTVQLTATPRDSRGNELFDRSIRWASNDSAVA